MPAAGILWPYNRLVSPSIPEVRSITQCQDRLRHGLYSCCQCAEVEYNRLVTRQVGHSSVTQPSLAVLTVLMYL